MTFQQLGIIGKLYVFIDIVSVKVHLFETPFYDKIDHAQSHSCLLGFAGYLFLV